MPTQTDRLIKLLPLTKSGDSPSPLNCLTLCWVGLVFCSPVILGWKIDAYTQNASIMQMMYTHTHLRDKADVDVGEVVVAYFKLKLAKSFHKGHSLNVTNSSTQLKKYMNVHTDVHAGSAHTGHVDSFLQHNTVQVGILPL